MSWQLSTGDVQEAPKFSSRQQTKRQAKRFGVVAGMLTPFVALVSCGDFIAPEVVGTGYALVSVYGAALPHRMWETDSTCYADLIADTLLFDDADSLTFSSVVHSVCATEDTTYTALSRMAYEWQSSDRVVIVEECSPLSCSCREDHVETGILRGDTLITNRQWVGEEDERVFVLVNGGS